MCGVAGYVGLSAAEGGAVLHRMARVQQHRGPDGEGSFTHNNIGVAHQRLAIIDREGGDQPMFSPDRRFVLVYNGEVYNFRELRSELAGLGHTFRTASDSEVVLAAWCQWGRAAFDRFNGMFALAIVDTHTNSVTLARDHFGIKPLYFAEFSHAGNTGVAFASELKGVLATGLIPRRPDNTTVYRYLKLRTHDDTPRTFFAGITRLMPGEMATIESSGEIHRSTYTSFYSDLRELAAHPEPYSPQGRDRFAEALHTSVRQRLVSEVPVGSALSGGIDSSTVVALINNMLAENDTEAAAVGAAQNSFSAIFPGEANDEERYVDAVTTHCSSSALRVHKILSHVEGFRNDLPDFIRTLEEPVISTGPYAQYCVMREASKHVTVMLDGQGADEMMAGYLGYYLVYLRQVRQRGGALSLLTEGVRSMDMLMQLARFRAGQLRVTDLLRRRALTPAGALLNSEFLHEHRGETMHIVRDDIKARMEDDIFRHSLPSLLRYEDRNTMRFSLEGRVPFLDTNLVKALWSMEDTAILDRSWNKRVLRDVADDLLPAVVARRRKKIGFTTPEDAWFKRLAPDIEEVFRSSSFAARPYFDQTAALRALSEFRRGHGGAETMTFWRLLNVELWMREFIDTDPTRSSLHSHAAPTTQE